MKRTALFMAAAAAALYLAASAAASPAVSAPPQDAIPWYGATRLQVMFPPIVYLSTIDRARAAVWRCQDRAELAASRAALSRGQLARSGHGFRGWVLDRWRAELAACERVLDRTLPAVGDWLTAVRVVQRAYPGSQWWLEACSSSEGGHGVWVWRGGAPLSSGDHGNVPGGWMQYFQSTFWSDYNPAAADLQARGFRIPTSARSWYSPLGQAVAAGWAYSHARPSGKWTGGRC